METDRITIGRLVSPPDEVLDMSEEEIEAAREFDRKERDRELDEDGRPSGIAIRHVRPKERGLMLIYLPWGVDDSTGIEYGGTGSEVVGYALSFPRSDTAVPIEYWVNPVYAEEEEHFV
jgi:hypothetical protein